MKKREPEEFVLRFFSYLNNYQNFGSRVDKFLNEYLEQYNDPNIDKDGMRDEFLQMLEFVDKYFPNGFSKSKGHVRTPRIRFEAIRPVRNIISSLKCLHYKQYKEYNLFLISLGVIPRRLRRLYQGC